MLKQAYRMPSRMALILLSFAEKPSIYSVFFLEHQKYPYFAYRTVEFLLFLLKISFVCGVFFLEHQKYPYFAYRTVEFCMVSLHYEYL